VGEEEVRIIELTLLALGETHLTARVTCRLHAYCALKSCYALAPLNRLLMCAASWLPGAHRYFLRRLGVDAEQ
jgi:hypothetical protein